MWYSWPQVDSAGNVVIVRSGLNSSSDRHTLVDVVSPTGTVQRVWDTLSMAQSSSAESFRYPGGEKFAMEPGAFYVPICANTCSATNPIKVYKIVIAGLGYDYPRSGWITQPGQLNYVALGDSFSSGEGVPPFIAGTDTGTNSCHRSTQAYAKLLDSDPSLNLRLTAFRACSGATISAVQVGMQGESGQLDSIKPDTSIATITLGGNDVGFRDFAEDCITVGCAEGSEAYEDILYNIENGLSPGLSNVYDQILAKNTAVKLYVIGYPYLVINSLLPCTTNIDSSERSAIYDVITLLNTKVESAVQASQQSYGNRISYVTPNYTGGPFEGHTLCDAEPYFNGFNWPADPVSFSFHPNSGGQIAYSHVIRDFIGS